MNNELTVLEKNELETLRKEENFTLAMERFLVFMAKPPIKVKVEPKKGNFPYIPISEIENQLDTIFLGQWQSEITQTIIVGNEIVMNVKVGVLHPITKEWIWRAGTGAAMIRQKSGSKISDIDGKIPNAVEMDAPHAKADAIKNAVQSLGDFFGRNLRRKIEDVATYKPIHTPKITKKNESQKTQSPAE
jgi:hypothetical protein